MRSLGAHGVREDAVFESRETDVVAVRDVDVLSRELGALEFEHLFLYIFGKLVEEEEGAFGVWMSYLVTGIGANVASWLLLPKSVGGVLGIGGAATVSLGASGAVFGLFAVSVLVKLSWNWRRLLEVVILGQFVVDRFLSEAKMVAAAGSGVGAGNVNHVAHLGGAFAGVLLIFFLTRMVPP